MCFLYQTRFPRTRSDPGSGIIYRIFLFTGTYPIPQPIGTLHNIWTFFVCVQLTKLTIYEEKCQRLCCTIYRYLRFLILITEQYGRTEIRNRREKCMLQQWLYIPKTMIRITTIPTPIRQIFSLLPDWLIYRPLSTVVIRSFIQDTIRYQYDFKKTFVAESDSDPSGFQINMS